MVGTGTYGQVHKVRGLFVRGVVRWREMCVWLLLGFLPLINSTRAFVYTPPNCFTKSVLCVE